MREFYINLTSKKFTFLMKMIKKFLHLKI